MSELRGSPGAMRVVRRTSYGPAPDVNGCDERSCRPASMSKPRSRITRSVNASCASARELPREERHVGTRPICDLGDERDELVAQRVQQRLEPSEAHVGLERVEQRVVPVSVMPERIGLLLLERDDPLERRTERGEVASRARALPDLEALGLCHRELAHEVGRHLHRAVAVASRLAEARPLSLVERVAGRLCLLDRLSERGVDHTLVQQRCQGRRLVGARLGALRRHHHLLVPAHQAGDAAEVDQLVHPTLEGGPRGRRHQ